jgi:hypothetical protein
MLVLSQAKKQFSISSNFKSVARGRTLKTLFLAGMLLVLTAILIGCGGDGDETTVIIAPGLVGIDDSEEATAPLLIVTYTVPPSPVLITVNILSDPVSDGDIAFDPVLNTFTVTTGPPEVLFGEDSSDMNLPEFRAFLTFPLDGITGQPVVPSDAVIVSAFLEVLVTQVNFALSIPTFLDLVQYPFRGLSAVDFNIPILTPTSFRTLNFFYTDQGNFVRIDVTSLMQEAQLPPALLDFQVRFSVETAAALSSSRASSAEASRSVHSPLRALDNILLNRGSSSAKPLTQEALTSRRR